MKEQERVPDGDRTDGEIQKTEKSPFFATNRGKLISTMIFVMIIAVVVTSRLGGKGAEVSYEMDDASLGVACMDFPAVFMDYGNITGVEKVTSFRMGIAVDSREWDSGWCGTYESEAFGVYSLFAYSSTGEYIIVHSPDQVLVFNAINAKQTDAAYKELMERIAEAGRKE